MPELSNSVVVAAIQAAPVSFDLLKSLQKVAEFTSQAAAAGADLVVFPEGFLSAYPWRYAFDATIGTREPRGRKWYSRYYNSALAIPSPELDQLCDIARNNNVHLQLGIIEKDGGTLYCTALLLSRDGAVLSRHRKTDRQVKETVQERPTGVSFMLSNGYHGHSQSRRRPTAITSKEGLILINVACNRTTKSQSFLASVFSQLEQNGLVPDLVTTSERNVSLAIQASNDFVIGNKLVLDLQKFGSVTILENINIVSVIGQRMRSMVGTASKSSLQKLQESEGKQPPDTDQIQDEIFSALASAKNNIYLISQGASEINISFVVKAEDSMQAINVVHARALQIPTHLEQDNNFIKGPWLY